MLQVGPEVFEASARPATADERARLWQMMVAMFPYYEGYQAKTTREVPVVVVERVGHDRPNPETGSASHHYS